MTRSETDNPLLTLDNGTTMPAIGLGVLDRSGTALTAASVEAAVAGGDRLIDTAAADRACGT